MQVALKYLNAVPKIEQNYKVEQERVVLLIYRNSWVDRLICWLFGKPRIGELRLDSMSSQAFLLIDQQKTLQEIAQELLQKDQREHPQETLESMQIRLAQFLSYLHHRKFISLIKKN